MTLRIYSETVVSSVFDCLMCNDIVIVDLLRLGNSRIERGETYCAPLEEDMLAYRDKGY